MFRRLVRRLATEKYTVDVAGAALHRSAITQELWTLRTDQGSAAPPPPNADGTRFPSHSRVKVRYLLASDAELRARYESAFGTVRLGVLFEDMDALAGSVAWRHVDDADPATDPPVLVTASVEEIVLNRPLMLDADYKLVGQVVWTGRSSIMIAVELVQDQVVLSGVFTYVARKRDGSGADKVFPLVPQTPDEISRYEAAAAKQLALKEQRKKKTGLLSEAQKQRVEDLLDSARTWRDFPGQSDACVVEMHRTGLKNALMCHPQERNTAGRVFGGVLIRRALEIAFATAFQFGGTEPQLLELERVDFLKAVDVGSLLALNSLVTLTEPDATPALVHVHVMARTWVPQIPASILNNTFTFVFAIHDPPRPIKAVLPSLRTEAELQVRARPRGSFFPLGEEE